jgi:hypothetical protein
MLRSYEVVTLAVRKFTELSRDKLSHPHTLRVERSPEDPPCKKQTPRHFVVSTA